MELTSSLYHKIRKEVETDLEVHNTQKWFNYSYALFTNHKLESIDDFWKIVAFAYSWMPTIPTIHYAYIEGKEEQVLKELKKLPQGKADIVWLFNTLTPVINNSVVGTSKVLHFIAPTQVPIYDSRVISAWQKLFSEEQQFTLKSRKGNINKVLFFIEKMNIWLANLKDNQEDISLRDIELVLYYYGKY
jgi:hypothetical protein